MTGDIERAITLTTFGNEFLRNNIDISVVSLNHPSFKSVNSITFYIFKKHFWYKPTWHYYANTIDEWFNKLKLDGCQEIRLSYFPNIPLALNEEKLEEFKLAGFVGGGGKRYIKTIFRNHCDFWESKERVTDANAPNQKIWSVNYNRVIWGESIQDEQKYNIDDIRAKLESALQAIAAFAKMESLSFWEEWFLTAIDLLDSRKQSERIYNMLPENHFSSNVIQLLASADKAWCFGGMGSWNDIGFFETEKNTLYKKLSSDLYNVVNESYTAVANLY